MIRLSIINSRYFNKCFCVHMPNYCWFYLAALCNIKRAIKNLHTLQFSCQTFLTWAYLNCGQKRYAETSPWELSFCFRSTQIIIVWVSREYMVCRRFVERIPLKDNFNMLSWCDLVSLHVSLCVVIRILTSCKMALSISILR